MKYKHALEFITSSLTYGTEGKGAFLQGTSCLSLRHSILEGQTVIQEQSEYSEITRNCSSPRKDNSSLASNVMT